MESSENFSARSSENQFFELTLFSMQNRTTDVSYLDSECA